MKHLQDRASELAFEWLSKSRNYVNSKDFATSTKMNKLFTNKQDKNTLVAIVDRAFRSKNTKEIAKNISEIFKKDGIPSFFSLLEKLGAIILIHLHPLLHFIMVPVLRYYILKTAQDYVLFGEDDVLNDRIKSNLQKNLYTNVNRVGELLLGEKDASSRIKRYIQDLENPNITCISIKISTIYSQISAISTEESVQKIVDAVTPIYRASKKNKYKDKEGKEKYKLVNFDMEEYRDLDITLKAFMQALEKDEFGDLQAGIALQAYLPDSYKALETLTDWAKNRVSQGKSPVRVRVVKGANMDMEVFESGERNWNLAPFSAKHLTDANYKKMLNFALQKQNIEAVNIGVASHNLFDIAFIYLLAKENGVLEKVQFEMLSGMSPSVSYFLANEVGLKVLLYLPFSAKEEFISSIGYLVRRFDENTSPENYLRYIHGLTCASEQTNEIWNKLKEKFIKSLNTEIESHEPNRAKDFLHPLGFINEPDTDFAVEKNRKKLDEMISKFKNFVKVKIPAVIQNNEVFDDVKDILNHNDETSSQIIATFHNSNMQDAKNALNSSKIWNVSFEERKNIILKVIKNIREKRFDIMGIMALNTGKPASEADAEVSEAIDFGAFYLHSFEKLQEEIKEIKTKPKGVCLVVSPWNFPFAIPAGGIFASLIAGNGCIFKPSNFSILVGYELAKCFWEAGVPKDILQFIPTDNSETAITLTSSKLVNFIVFTGSTQTALSILKNNPSVDLAAETGGKNFTIVTKNADRDAAIKNILHSAFSNAGQKCSATSIVALESEIFNDEKFLETLKDGAESLKVGYGLEKDTKIPQLIRKPLPELEWALNHLEEGEKWLLKPKCFNTRETMWSAGIKLLSNSARYKRTHNTEFFGPILAILEINNLQEGIELANSTGYGLTSALESLNEEEHEIWKEGLKAGNLYINRSTTGAIVLRQPFGGMGKSAFGSGIKAGGYNYITQFLNFEGEKAQDYHSIFKNYFAKEMDYLNISGQQNISRFLKLEKIAIRIEKKDNKEIELALLASNLCAKEVCISAPSKEIVSDLKLPSNAFIAIETQEIFIAKINDFERIKFIGEEGNLQNILQEACKTGIFIIKHNSTGAGRIDLLSYLKEQSVSYNYHRYGLIDTSKMLPLK
jgi:RHH-type proline utilization regulon transcriptional repressor/proline dehydrogenase/delta 1-pyrroline-5-carboxylate dehydrogenase